MRFNFKIIFVIILLFILIFGIYWVYTRINTSGGEQPVNKSYSDLIKENQELKDRVKQLENTSKLLTGDVPNKKLTPLSGIIFSQEPIDQDSLLLEINLMELDKDALKLDPFLLQLDEEDKIMKVKINEKTNLNLTMLAEGESIETGGKSQRVELDQLRVTYRAPYPAIVQAENPEPDKDNTIEASTLTIFILLPEQKIN